MLNFLIVCETFGSHKLFTQLVVILMKRQREGGDFQYLVTPPFITDIK